MLPLLAKNKNDTRQALHTSFVNTAIDNMKDNRVLNNRPPPINDVETRFLRQRATLSHLHSGYCKLLNSYKKQLKQTDSSSCPDCGMDPQNVPHLAPNDTAYKRWSCHSGFKLLCKLCRTSPPPAMGARFTVFFGHAGHADPLDGWRCCSQKRVMSRPIQVRQL